VATNQSAGFILGAGFSCAISKHMPDMKKLRLDILKILENNRGIPVMEALRVQLDKVQEDGLEMFLSHLSGNEPWQSESQALRNNADFLELSWAIGKAIWSDQGYISEDNNPNMQWARSFVWECMKRRVVMATLNYDTIIEEIINQDQSVDYLDYYPVEFSRLSKDIEPGENFYQADTAATSLYSIKQGKPKPLFKLHKLHGSLNWYYLVLFRR
jgi:hypothetical protein